MKILIADDEPLARQRLARMAAQLPGCQVLAEQATNGQQAIELCNRLQPDILLLDIEMPELDGLAVASILGRQASAPAIIFCTAHDSFALPAFAVNAQGYLVKPVRMEQLQQAIEHAARLNPMQLATLRKQSADSRTRTHISSTTHKGIECVALSDILYLEAEHKYVTVYHLAGRTLIDEPLKALESEFPDLLIRIHRSILVNRSFIERLERYGTGQHLLFLKDHEQPLSVSRRHVSSLRDLMRVL